MRVLRHAMKGSWLVLAVAMAGAPLAAQDLVRGPAAVAQQGTTQQQPGFDKPAGQEAKKVDIILPHISDSDELDVPWLNAQGFKVVRLPHWAPVMIGGYALDLSPTKSSYSTSCSSAVLLWKSQQGRKPPGCCRPPNPPPHLIR